MGGQLHTARCGLHEGEILSRILTQKVGQETETTETKPTNRATTGLDAGFTLIELRLIIAIAEALLLPALAKVKQKALLTWYAFRPTS